MPNVMATLLNIGGALCESSIIPEGGHNQGYDKWRTSEARRLQDGHVVYVTEVLVVIQYNV